LDTRRTRARNPIPQVRMPTSEPDILVQGFRG
jgi:hypothetical protein